MEEEGEEAIIVVGGFWLRVAVDTKKRRRGKGKESFTLQSFIE
jgi:hypothetical protein